MRQFPKLYHPDHAHNEHPEPAKRKTLTACSQEEYDNLLRLGWKVAPDDFLKVKQA